MNNIFSTFWLEHPLITLWALWVAALLYLYLLKNWSHGRYFNNFALLKEVYKHNTFYHIILQWLIVCIIWVYAIILWNPYIANYRESKEKEAHDIIFVFDLSYSMIADDIAPNRLEAAKNMFLELTDSLGNNRLWLVLYAWKAFQSVPLSFDTNFMRKSIENINVESLPQMRFSELQGTAIWDWLLMWIQSLDMSDNQREKIIILMTDGEENRGVESRKVIPLLQKSAIKTITIAFWKDENAVIELQNQFWVREKLAVWWIDEQLLREIAEKTYWEYFRANDTEAIQNIVTSLSELNTWIVEIETYVLRRPLFWEWLLILLLLHLMLWWIFIYKKYRY